jgi:hypothetical protein
MYENELSRDFQHRPIFDFCDSIRSAADHRTPVGGWREGIVLEILFEVDGLPGQVFGPSPSDGLFKPASSDNN